MIRIILRRYKYPPDKQLEAIKMVMQQAEVLSDEWTSETPKGYMLNSASYCPDLMAVEVMPVYRNDL